VARLLKVLKGLLQEGAKPVIFCRFIATAEALGEEIKRAWPKADVAVVTGRLPPEERRTRIDQLEDSESRILVATDCLSEGINLQALFDAVVHYDLSWNPTRHQQREGRVDRFGQRSPVVRSVTIFGDNSAIDGAVLQVILRKAEAIRKATGISVPMPEDSEGVTSALMQALMLRAGGHREQLAFDFGLSSERLDSKWRDAEENAKASFSNAAWIGSEIGISGVAMFKFSGMAGFSGTMAAASHSAWRWLRSRSRLARSRAGGFTTPATSPCRLLK
jgi:superfamily II DNA/RNA helicase